MGVDATPHGSTGVRWLPAWHVSFYAILLGVTAVALVQPGDVRARLLIAGLALALGAWYVPFAAREHRMTTRWALAGLAYMALGWAFWIGLVAETAIALVLLGVIIPLLARRLAPPWSIAALVILTLLWTGWLALATHAVLVALLLALGTGPLSILFTLYVESVSRENRRRAMLLAELEATRNELAAAERLAGTIEERQRLAAELHDTVIQALAGTVLHLESARQALPEAAAEARRRLELALRGARDSLAEARSLTQGLQPAALSSGSLGDALGAHAERWSEEYGVPVELRTTGTAVAMRPEAAVTLLRAAQESLANVGRHAGAESVTMTLSYMDGLVTLDVRDDGRGFDPNRAPATPTGTGTGFGLAGLRGRVERQGGSLSIDSTPGEGTTIGVSIPVPAA